MRWLILVVVVLILIFGLSIWSHIFLQNTADVLNEELITITENIVGNQWEEAITVLDELNIKWESIGRKWTVLLDHQELDSIDKSLARLQQHLYVGDISMALAEISTVRFLIEHIPKKESFNLENLL